MVKNLTLKTAVLIVFLAGHVCAQTLLYQWDFDNTTGSGTALSAAPGYIAPAMTGGVLTDVNSGPGLSTVAGSGVYGAISASDLGMANSTAYRSTAGTMATGVGNLSSISSFTVCLWFKLNASVTNFSSLNGGAVVSRLFNIATTATGDGDELYFALNTGNALQCGVNKASTGPVSANTVFGALGTSPATMTNNWIFVAASYTNTGGGTVNLYTGTTNGAAALVGTLTSAGSIAWSATTNFIFIGNRYVGDRSLPGWIDNVSFHGGALTLAQIQAVQSNAAPDVNSPVAGTPVISPAGPIYQGSSITITSAVTGAAPFFYQWRTDGGSGGALTNIPNATNTSLATTPFTSGVFSYALFVTNSYGSVTSAVASITVLTVPGTANISVNVASNLATVASTAYGIHASIYANQLGNTGLSNQLVQAGVKTIRYPGGGLADVFHWSASRPALGGGNGYGLSPWFGVTNDYGYMGPKTDFGSFASLLTNGTFQAIITVNYGSGLKWSSAGHTNLTVPATNAEPPEAAAWVAYANSPTNIFGTVNDITLGVDSLGNDWKTAGYWAMMRAAAPLGTDDGYNFLRIKRVVPLGIKYWEIGNETFGTGYYSSGSDGYSVNYAVPYPNGAFTRYGNTNLSPAVYGKGVKAFSLLMKAVDPTIKIGAVVSTPPDDYSWDSYGGQRWTPQVLAQCATNMDFVTAHWYPAAGSLADGSALLADVSATLPVLIAGTAPHTGTSSGLRDWINAARADGTNVDIFITEFGYTGSVTNSLNGQPIFGPVNALFAADTYATCAELGVANADWLELTKTTFLGDSNPLTPGTVYYAAQLTSKMAVAGDKLVKTTSDVSQLRVHAAVRADGKLGLMLLNQNLDSNLVVNVTIANTNLSTSGVKYEFGTNNFSGGTQTPATVPLSNVVSSVGNAFSLTVPAYTMVVLAIPFAAPPGGTNTPPNLMDISDVTVNAGQTVAFTASATDTDAPPQTLTFTLLTAVTNATFDTNSGTFSWRPLVTQADSTNLFTLKVADNGSPVLSATQSFSVVVNPITLPTLTGVTMTNRQFRLTVNGQNGPDYEIQTSTNLAQWNVAFMTNSPAQPFVWTDAGASNSPVRFYRAVLGPPLP